MITIFAFLHDVKDIEFIRSCCKDNIEIIFKHSLGKQYDRVEYFLNDFSQKINISTPRPPCLPLPLCGGGAMEANERIS